MLSKIAFFETCVSHPDTTAEQEHILPSLRQRLQSSGQKAVITPMLGGTLGICFSAEIGTARQFLKIHLPGEIARANLDKEAKILSRLYGPKMVLDLFEITLTDGTSRLCLLMPELAPLSEPMQPDAAAVLARVCSDRLNDYRSDALPRFETYLAITAHALKTLQNQGLLKKGIAADARRLIEHLKHNFPGLPRALCHGDFGPKNIMTDDKQICVIDWEDAFLGVAGYDYLYWLTFMENRHVLQTSAFGRTDLAPEIERAILALVVLLKSYLAVCSGAYLSHAVSIPERITEILELRQ